MSSKPIDNLPPPRHIAVIMDGNGRWAKERGLSRSAGHEAGADAVKECVEGCIENKVDYLTVYAFSSENWKRPKTEIKALMTLLERFLTKKTPELIEQNIQFNVIGQTHLLPKSCQKQIQKTIEKSSSNTGLTLTLALSYGSREEITDAVKAIATQVTEDSLAVGDITSELISNHLYTRNIPDPDLLIRTSGEFRISNFLLWQISYSEIYVTSKFWPDFSKLDLSEAINNFHTRHRRFGGLNG